MSAPDLSAYDPDPDALLDWLRRRVSDASLAEIARADYGADFGEHLSGLRAIRDTGRVPAALGWVPGEVLELVRWDEPDDQAGHIRRAFACAALLRRPAEPDTVAQLLASVAAIGTEAERAALRTFAWLATQSKAPHDTAGCLALAVAMLVLAGDDPPPADDWLQALGWWVIGQVEAEGHGYLGGAFFGLKYATWQRLAADTRERVERLPPGDGREVLREVVGLITPGS